MAPTSRPPVHSTSYSSCYSVTRPAPPASLLRSLLAAYSASDDSLHPGDIARETPGLAVDVGCGSGQLTIELAAVCREVVGLDPSSLQLQEARRAPNIEYREGCGQSMPGVADGSVDLVTVCQALHYLSPPSSLYLEAARVLRPGGLLAVIGYHFSRPSDPGLCAAMEAVYAATLPYWSYPRHWVDSAYRSLPPPPTDLLSLVSRQDDHFTETLTTLAGWAAYIASWSGFRGLCKEVGAAEGRRLLAEFLGRCMDLLGRRGDTPARVEVTLKTEYWLIVYTK